MPDTTPPVTGEIEARRFRKKPVVIEAWQFVKDNAMPKPVWLDAAIADGKIYWQGGPIPFFTIETLEGFMRAHSGDWIIQGVKGEIYPCREDIFHATYSLDRASGDGVRAQTIEECAKIADIYAAGKAGKIINRLDTRSISQQISIAIRALSAVSMDAQPLPTAGGWRLVPVDDDTRPFCDGLLPPAMIAAGEDALDNAENDLQNYVSGETIDWDNGMIAVAVYRAMLAAAPAPPAPDKG